MATHTGQYANIVKIAFPSLTLSENGTQGLEPARQALYSLSYIPICFSSIVLFETQPLMLSDRL